MFGVLLGDSVVFFIGRHGINSNNFVARHVQKVMTPKRLAWAEKHFAKHGNLTVFAGRFMPGFRAVVFAMAGASRMSYFRFIIVNGFAALVSVPLWVILGHYLASWVPKEKLESKIHEYQHIILPILGGIALVVAIWLFIRWRRSKKLKAAALAAAEGIPATPDPAADKTPAQITESSAKQ
jgi:membrane protein DedA with SNARE-associated domain